ncbi:hypothetical protein KIN20_006909 [Parelaphostrongylus tenuis]|uniref:Uncharacterized protein n=1 Tax=Parelaphostrongylus tenuis TaxID=148309 RepID=A0AAD5ML51_PARTN|nr:hypothetical protein KIN20_006909 [Parelaphostrongylus tenuis]
MPRKARTENNNYRDDFDVKVNIPVQEPKHLHERLLWLFRIPVWNHGNLSIPQNTKRFLEYLKRSRLLQCRGMKVERKEETRYLPLEKTLQTMSSLMSYLIDFDIYPFLNGGTLLGWYRECDIIPHTYDADFAALIEQYNPDLLKHLLSNETKFRLTTILGRMNDSHEFKFRPLDGGPPSIDLFWMYSSEKESWVGGTASDGSKFKYTYPSCGWRAAEHLQVLTQVRNRPNIWGKAPRDQKTSL